MDALLVMCAISMAVAIALCGVPFGLIIGKRLAGIDVRDEGSGNIGMTNVARTAGGAAGALTFACDVGKGLVSMLFARIAIMNVLPEGTPINASAPAFAALTIVYACCVLGHVFSPYLGFHGGKGISVGFGAALALHWPVALILLAVFLVGALPTRYISVGSLAAAISLPLQCAFIWHMTGWALVPIVLAAGVVVWAHRANVVRLLHGEENAFSIGGTSHRRRRKVDPTRRRDGEESEGDLTSIDEAFDEELD